MFSQQRLIERTTIKNIKETPFRVEKIENTVSSRATDDISNGYLDLQLEMERVIFYSLCCASRKW